MSATLVHEIINGVRTPVYVYDTVSTFTSVIPEEGASTWETLKELPARLLSAIERVCEFIQEATDLVPTSETPEDATLFDAYVADLEAKQAEDAYWDKMAEAHGYEPAAYKPTPMAKNAVAWTLEHLSITNPWELLESAVNDLYVSPSGGEAMLEIFKDTRRTHPNKVFGMAVFLRTRVRELLAAYDELSHEKGVDLKGKRPADIYRGFCKPLEWLAHDYNPIVGPTLRHLLEEQTIPFAELDNPDWIDPYTGDFDPTAERLNIDVNDDAVEGMVEEDGQVTVNGFEIGEDGVARMFTTVITPESMKLTAEASEACGGGSEPENSGIEAEMEEVGEDEEKDFQFSGEVRTTEDIGRLRAVMANEITNLAQKLASVRMAATLEGVSEANKERDLFIQGRMHKKPAYSDFLSKLTWLASAKSYKDDRDKWIRWYENKIERLEKYDASKLDAEGKERYFVAVKRNRNGLEYLLANQAEGPMPQDLFAIILPFVSDDCYPESILKTIPLVPARAGCDNLGQWVEMFGGEMIADMFDDGIGVQELSEEEIENFTVDTLKRLKKTFAGVSITKVFPETKASEEVIAEYRANQQFRKYDQKNPAAAEAFAEAFYRTSFTEKNLFRVDKGRRINKAEENGYRAFRQAISPEGDAEYAKARAAGKSDKDAMAAFWEFVRTHQTSKKDSVAKIAGDQTGLVLASGRKISWRIAIMKQQAKELEWADGTKDRLKAVLVSMGIGLEFVKAL